MLIIHFFIVWKINLLLHVLVSAQTLYWSVECFTLFLYGLLLQKTYTLRKKQDQQIEAMCKIAVKDSQRMIFLPVDTIYNTYCLMGKTVQSNFYRYEGPLFSFHAEDTKPNDHDYAAYFCQRHEYDQKYIYILYIFIWMVQIISSIPEFIRENENVHILISHLLFAFMSGVWFLLGSIFIKNFENIYHEKRIQYVIDAIRVIKEQ